MKIGIMVKWMEEEIMDLKILFYEVIYKMWIKRQKKKKIVIGGDEGEFKKMIGWDEEKGEIKWESIVMLMIILMWKKKNLWEMQMLKKNDYEEERIKMMNNVKGEIQKRSKEMLYEVIMEKVGVMKWVMGFEGMLYGVV